MPLYLAAAYSIPDGGVLLLLLLLLLLLWDYAVASGAGEPQLLTAFGSC